MIDPVLPSLVAELPGVTDRTMSKVFEAGRRRDGVTPVVLDGSRSLGFDDLGDEAARFASMVRSLGMARQDPVLVMLDNHVDHVVVWAGLGLAGLVSVPLNTAFRGELLEQVVNDSRAQVLVVEREYVDRFVACASQLEHLEVLLVRGGAVEGPGPGLSVLPFEDYRSADADELAPVRPWEVHSVMYTSGTTGDSKGVIVSHAQTYTRAASLQVCSSDGPETSLVTLPLFHVVGQCRGLYSALVFGARAVVRDRFSVSTFWEDVREHNVTYTSLLGSMATFLAKQPVSEQDADNPLRRVVMAPTIPHVEEFERRFGVEVMTSYGSTEIGSVTVGRGRGGGCGLVHPEFEVRLVDEHDLPVGPGGRGEMLVRSHQPWVLTAGYWRRPDATVETLRNMWFHTGDLFEQAPDGELTFVGRRKDMIRRRGENISAAEVERVAERHPAVHSAAAVAVPSEDAEDELKMVVTPSGAGELTESDLLRYLVEALPYFMVPRFIEIVDELERTETNKINKIGLDTVNDQTWDREAAGFSVTKNGLQIRESSAPEPSRA